MVYHGFLLAQYNNELMTILKKHWLWAVLLALLMPFSGPPMYTPIVFVVFLREFWRGDPRLILLFILLWVSYSLALFGLIKAVGWLKGRYSS